MHSDSAEVATPPAGLDSSQSSDEWRGVWRRPVVLAPALLLAAACIVRYEAEPRGFISGFAVAVLVVLAATDLETRLIPNRIVLPAAAIVLVAQLVFYPDRAAEWVVSALGAALFLFVPSVIKQGAVGMGDVKLALLLGATLGWAVLAAMLVGFLAMAPVAIYLLVREGVEARKKYLPLGPFLAFGAVFVLLLGGGAS